MEELLQDVVGSGALKASTVPEVCDAYFMVVPTPFKGDHEPDVSYVEAATRAVLPLLKEGDLYVIESTSPVGTTEMMANIIFTERPEPLTAEEKRAWLDSRDAVALGSDAFFPFPDSVKRGVASGVKYIAEPGGSIRDDLVIECCNKYGMAMAFTGMRLFHH